MKIESARFGEIEVNPDTVLTFPKGLPGFEKCTRFHLLHEVKNGQAILYLQSAEDAGVSFPVVEPALFGFNYDLNLTDEEAALIQAEKPEDLIVLLLAYRPISETKNTIEPKTPIAAHIQGPLILNLDKKLGFQKVLVAPSYTVTLQE